MEWTTVQSLFIHCIVFKPYLSEAPKEPTPYSNPLQASNSYGNNFRTMGIISGQNSFFPKGIPFRKNKGCIRSSLIRREVIEHDALRHHGKRCILRAISLDPILSFDHEVSHWIKLFFQTKSVSSPLPAAIVLAE